MADLLNYINTQYGGGSNKPNAAVLSDQDGLSAGQGQTLGRGLGSLKENLKAFLPLAALSMLAGKFGGGEGLDVGGAASIFTKNFLDAKLKTAMEDRQRKVGQEDFFINEAYKAVDELKGADLSGIDVPDNIKTSLAELHKKANEALLNDGVISPKEAQTLLAMAGPIKAALAEQKTKQATPAYQEGKKEEGVLAKFLQQAKQMPEMPLSQAEEGDFLQGRSPEQIETYAKRELYAPHVEAQSAMEIPGLGMVPRKEGVSIQKAREAELGRKDRADASLKERRLSRIMRDRHFQASLGRFDARQQADAAFRLQERARMAVQQRLQAAGDTATLQDQTLFQNEVDAEIDRNLAALGGVVPGSRGALPIPIRSGKAAATAPIKETTSSGREFVIR